MNVKIFTCALGLLLGATAHAETQTKPVTFPSNVVQERSIRSLNLFPYDSLTCDSSSALIGESSCVTESTSRGEHTTKGYEFLQLNAVEAARAAGIPTAVRADGVRHFKLLNLNCRREVCTADAVYGEELDAQSPIINYETMDKTYDPKTISYVGTIPGQLAAVLRVQAKVPVVQVLPDCYCLPTYHTTVKSISCEEGSSSGCQITKDNGQVVNVEGDDAQAIHRFLAGPHAIRLLKADGSHKLSIKNVDCEGLGKYQTCSFTVD